MEAYPSDAERVFAHELVVYLVAKREGGENVVAMTTCSLSSFFAIWSGGYFRRDGITVVSVQPGSVYDREVLITELTLHFKSCILHKNPPRPSLGKWTPFGLNLDWNVPAMTSNDCNLVEPGPHICAMQTPGPRSNTVTGVT